MSEQVLLKAARFTVNAIELWTGMDANVYAKSSVIQEQ